MKNKNLTWGQLLEIIKHDNFQKNNKDNQIFILIGDNEKDQNGLRLGILSEDHVRYKGDLMAFSIFAKNPDCMDEFDAVYRKGSAVLMIG
ncbi:hypothetical protein SAMN04515674_105306 [Pseudarcicella hirudinis]|uniref:Uncharacterized protein n=1 Tax=Pseudarcicella hirudinis TaxID=1079859 RepID=A0A1I5T0A5_9BACT|nr:hypothetical protein [Pseudarcicella hirudinis]SFP76453.1 hypothetical protein SAMN04515674_105306 [Pseudarcicella hirudinis]